MTTYTATYSPDENKLRLYASTRLEPELYQRVRDAGFTWAPKQELFVASWTPDRADLLTELADEIEDEDKSLVERAEERAERFAGYSDSRAKEADSAHAAVHAISEHIPFGQPILVGHHSERRARKDAQRIHDNMRKAVSLWDISNYWTQRAAGAIASAKYKERTDVRARRIKTIEADLRKSEKGNAETNKFLELWQQAGLTLKLATVLAGYSHFSRCFTLADFPRDLQANQYEGQMSLYSALSDQIVSVDQAREMSVNAYSARIARSGRWIEHYKNRITYERAMLDEQGGLKAEQVDIAVGGRVLVRGEWLTVMRLNKKAGKLLSVTTNARFVRVRPIEEIEDYQAPSAEVAATVAAAMKKPTICNYPREDFLLITQAQWDGCDKDYKGTQTIEASARHAAHRVRKMLGTHAGIKSSDWNLRHSYPLVYITDAKRSDPPAAAVGTTEAEPAPRVPAPESVTRACRAPTEPAAPNKFEILQSQLSAGVQVVAAPQLFPTPAHIARRMVDEAGLQLGMRVLEPSAGTARILQALPFVVAFGATRQTGLDVVAVEINPLLAGALECSGLAGKVVRSDFLACGEELGLFDRIVLNPPFSSGADIAHIKHAMAMLKPGGGRLVAICANGPRQNAELLPLVERCGGIWEPLPDGSFKDSGTNVSTVLLSLEA
jgi:hypothetical protein